MCFEPLAFSSGGMHHIFAAETRKDIYRNLMKGNYIFSCHSYLPGPIKICFFYILGLTLFAGSGETFCGNTLLETT